MDNKSESKKCFCARCFLPVDQEDRVDIEGQNFHKICSMCCVCRTVPTSLKMFYGHVFCNSCFKSHVLSHLKNDGRVHSNSWWMQWAPGVKANVDSKEDESKPQSPSQEPPKRGICSRCLLPMEEDCKVQIGDQAFHRHCAECYFCHSVPTANPKIYYGQLFCEDCFHRYVLNKSRDNPSEFFRSCFETWQNNTQFADNMREFMSGSKESAAPFVFMMQGAQPPFCRCGTGPQDWFQPNEAKKSATATTATGSVDGESFATVELSFEYRTDASEAPECSAVGGSAIMDSLNATGAAEKIEKLTKYLHERHLDSDEKCPKKWKNYVEADDASTMSEISYSEWMDLQEWQARKRDMECPKCLWQCGGPIFVNSDYLQNRVVYDN